MDRLASKSFSRKREERRDAIDKVRCPARSSGPLGPDADDRTVTAAEQLGPL
jgi:hypothetical protein